MEAAMPHDYVYCIFAAGEYHRFSNAPTARSGI
nr:MAG TPA_asm: hypothetical protein [Caudoviricetes sp.]